MGSIARAQQQASLAAAAAVAAREPSTISAEGGGKAVIREGQKADRQQAERRGGAQAEGPAGRSGLVAFPGEGCGQRGLEAAPFLQLGAYLGRVREKVVAAQEAGRQLRSQLEAAVGSMQTIVSKHKVAGPFSLRVVRHR